MFSSTVVPSLMFMTLGIVFLIALVIAVRFLRRRSNRHPMENQRERNIDEIRSGTPPKA